jgi:hypothetical protein
MAEEEGELPDIPESEGMDNEPEANVEAGVAEDGAEVSQPEQEFDLIGAIQSIPGYENASGEELANQILQSRQREQQAYEALQQYQSIIPAASDYLSHREEFEAWRNHRNQPQYQQPASPQQVAPQEEPSWWNPPRVRDGFKQYLVRDQEGREVISDNAPLEARAQLQEYQAYKADFARKFLDDPQGALGPMVEKIVTQRAAEIAEKQVSGLKDEQLVQQLEAQNADWLYDENRNVSREGLLVQKYIEDAKTKGINGVQSRWDYAVAMVERDLALAKFQFEQQQPQQQAQPQPQVAPQPAQETATSAEKNMAYLRQQAARTPTRRASTGTDSRKPQRPMSFEERMLANLQSSGLTE